MTSRPAPHAEARRAQNDAIRTLYEDTLVPVREIARIAGVTERNIYALVRRLGCRPRVRLASGGGRRIVPLAATGEPPPALDMASVNSALKRCQRAVRHANRLTVQARAERDKRAALRQGGKDAATQARTFALVVRAMRDLAAVVDSEPARELRKQARALKPRKRRGYQFKPMLVSSHR